MAEELTKKLDHVKERTINSIDHFLKYLSVLNVSDEKDKKIMSIGSNMLKQMASDLETGRLTMGEVFDMTRLSHDIDKVIEDIETVDYSKSERVLSDIQDQILELNPEED